MNAAHSTQVFSHSLPAIALGENAVLPQGFTLGHAHDAKAATGCTIVLCEAGAVGGVSVRGAAPATVETDLLNSRNTVERINGVMLSGGSAFGIEAASGAMQWLSERKAGFEIVGTRMPIVCGASIFDLTVGKSTVYPDKHMGYAACKAAGRSIKAGNVGAGTGASVGKFLGPDFAMKAGFGCASLCIDELLLAAVVVVNAVGNVYDRQLGQALAGVLDPANPTSLLCPYQAAYTAFTAQQQASLLGANTTIGCIITNAMLTKAQATRVADMTHDGYARAIEPVHTGFDGDAIFVLATGAIGTNPDFIGILAARVMEAAIHNAVLTASSAYGLLSAQDLIAANNR